MSEVSGLVHYSRQQFWPVLHGQKYAVVSEAGSVTYTTAEARLAGWGWRRNFALFVFAFIESGLKKIVAKLKKISDPGFVFLNIIVTTRTAAAAAAAVAAAAAAAATAA